MGTAGATSDLLELVRRVTKDIRDHDRSKLENWIVKNFSDAYNREGAHHLEWVWRCDQSDCAGEDKPPDYMLAAQLQLVRWPSNIPRSHTCDSLPGCERLARTLDVQYRHGIIALEYIERIIEMLIRNDRCLVPLRSRNLFTRPLLADLALFLTERFQLPSEFVASFPACWQGCVAVGDGCRNY